MRRTSWPTRLTGKGVALGSCDVLIVGAGHTGLALALWLRRLGANARIIDKTAAPGTTSRALAIQARTLELYQQIDLADAVVARAHKVPAVNLWARGAQKARISFAEIGRGLTPFPGLYIFAQDEHEALLISQLETMGLAVEAKRPAKHRTSPGATARGRWFAKPSERAFPAELILRRDRKLRDACARPARRLDRLALSPALR